MKILKKMIIMTVFVMLVITSFAAENEKKDKGIIALPAIFSTPETGFAGGLFGMYFDKKGRENNPDTIQGGLIITAKNQKSAFFAIQKTIDKTILSADLATQSWPYRFYERTTEKSSYESYTDNSIQIKIKGQREISKGWKTGPSLRFMYSNPSNIEKNGVIEKLKPYGIDETLALGLGINLEYDSRNASFYPTKGDYLQAELTLFDNMIGSDLEFLYGIVDARKYIPVYNENCLALQFYFNGTEGDVPVQYMPSMGGQKVMRGFYQGRFNDKLYLAVQSEYRFKIYKWFGAAIFAGAGETAPSLSKMTISGVHTTYGAGLRFNVGKDDKMNIRMDFAFNDLTDKEDDKKGFYVNMMEAF